MFFPTLLIATSSVVKVWSFTKVCSSSLYRKSSSLRQPKNMWIGPGVYGIEVIRWYSGTEGIWLYIGSIESIGSIGSRVL